MVLGLVTYHIGRELFPVEDKTMLAPKEQHSSIFLKTVGGMLGIMVGFIVLLMLPFVAKLVVIAAILAAIYWAVMQVQGAEDRSRVAALVILCFGTIAFWAIFEQQGNTLQLWADEKADWARLGLTSEVFQSFNPAFIFIFAPIMDAWWNYNAARGRRSSSVRKMGIGCILAGAAFLVVPLAQNFITVDKSVVNMFWLAVTTLIFTLGELYLSPIGLSLVTKVAPVRLMSMMMGMWFISSFVGNYLAGELGALYSSMSETAFFVMFAILGGVVGLFFFASEKPLQKIIGNNV
jgi:proton-dependent oligopeptide transporter, POT family